MRTLLYEVFAVPQLRLLQWMLELVVSTVGLLFAHRFSRENQQLRPVPIAPK